MSKKNLIIIIVAVILIIVGVILLKNNSKSKENNAGGTTTVVESPIAKKKTNGTFDMYNTDITTDTGSTKITATIENISGKTTPQQLLEVVLLDKNSNELGTVKLSVPELEAGVATEVLTESLKVYEGIYDFKIK